MNRLAALGLTACCIALSAARFSAETLAEAPAGYDNQTNGFLSQATFEAYRALFEQRMGITDGLGPVYEAPSCAQCHYNPLLASSSTATVLQVGHFDGTSFIAHPGGSQIHSSAIDPAIQERVLPGHEVRAFQVATNLLGAGFVEAIADQALRDTAARQPIKMRGTLINVPVLEAGGAPAVGKFGLKAYHASLLSATAQSFRDYLGITNVWLPEENTSNGNPVDEFDAVPDPEDMGGVDAVTAFLRSTKVPPRDPELVGTRDVIDGERIFDRIGCAVCHVPSITTAPPGTLNNAGTFTVPPVLGDRRFIRTATSCCTTSAPATASWPTVRRARAIRFARFHSGACA